MQRHIISVSTITYAIKGRDVLRKQGLRTYIEKKTNESGNAGCGYVIVAYGDLHKIKSALKNAGVNILQINTVA